MAPSSPTESTEPRTDGRARPRRATDAKITAAVLQLMRSVGPAGVTIDAVSATSGVAKTTLYRRYADRFEMLEAVAAALPTVQPASTEPNLAGFRALLAQIKSTFDTVGPRFVTQVLSGDDQFMVAWRSRLIGPKVSAVDGFFAGAVEVGILRADVNYRVIQELIVGGAIAASAQPGDLPEDWADDVAQALWPAIVNR